MHPDLFRNKKGVHVKLDKEVHAEFRKKLLDHGVSMQAIFNEFARLVAAGDRNAMRIVESHIRRRLRDEIEKHKPGETNIDELDHDALYDLISEGDQDEETDEDEDEDLRHTG